jgi:hypothetical protein
MCDMPQAMLHRGEDVRIVRGTVPGRGHNARAIDPTTTRARQFRATIKMRSTSA